LISNDLLLGLGGLLCAGLGALTNVFNWRRDSRSSGLTDLKTEVDLWQQTTNAELDRLRTVCTSQEKQIAELTKANQRLTDMVTSAGKIDDLTTEVREGLRIVDNNHQAVMECLKALAPPT
jgi:hypothetical protein